MDKPILLVDVDGVLNVFGFDVEDENGSMGEPGTQLEKVFMADGGSRLYKIRFPAGLTDTMKQLVPHFDCVWATTWEERARDQIAPELGAGHDWPVVNWVKGSVPEWGHQKTWKLADVHDWVEANARDRRVAWIDDDLHADAWRWADVRGNTKLVCTSPETGLTDLIAQGLIRWAKGE